MNITFALLRQWATEAGHIIDGEVQGFLTLIEGKQTAIDNAKALLESEHYTVTPPAA